MARELLRAAAGEALEAPFVRSLRGSQYPPQIHDGRPLRLQRAFLSNMLGLWNSVFRRVIMTNKKLSPFTFGSAHVPIAVIALVILLARGLTLSTLLLIAGVALLWVVIWIGGFRAGDAFARWLERR